MAHELHRRLTRLERQGRPVMLLVQAWFAWLCNWETIVSRAAPNYRGKSKAELLAEAQREAATGETPSQVWVEAMVAAWQERGMDRDDLCR